MKKSAGLQGDMFTKKFTPLEANPKQGKSLPLFSGRCLLDVPEGVRVDVVSKPDRDNNKQGDLLG